MEQFIEYCRAGDLINAQKYSDGLNLACIERAFCFSCRFGHIEMIKYLISLKDKYGQINIHASNEHAFRFSCEGGHFEVIKYLISLKDEYGPINIHAYDEDGFRASCERGRL